VQRPIERLAFSEEYFFRRIGTIAARKNGERRDEEDEGEVYEREDKEKMEEDFCRGVGTKISSAVTRTAWQ